MKHLWLWGIIMVCLLAACSNDQASPEDLESSQDQTDASGQDEQSAQDTADDKEANTDDKSSETDKNSSDDTVNDDSESESANQDTTDGTSSNDSDDNSQTIDGNSSDQDKEPKQDLNKGFNQYRPKEGLEKTFVQDEEYELTYNTVAVNNTLVQRVVKFGDIVTLQILKWTSDGASIVYQEQSPKSTKNQLDSYDPYEPPVKIVNMNKKGKGTKEQWEVINTDKQVKVPYKTLDHVVVVRQTLTSESSGNKTVVTDYYAKDLGLIKETREVKGNNGYTSKSELERVKK